MLIGGAQNDLCRFTIATSESIIELEKIQRKIEQWSIVNIIKWSENGRR